MAQEAGNATNGQALLTPDAIVRRLREFTLFSRLTDEEFKAVLRLMRARAMNEARF